MCEILKQSQDDQSIREKYQNVGEKGGGRRRSETTVPVVLVGKPCAQSGGKESLV